MTASCDTAALRLLPETGIIAAFHLRPWPLVRMSLPIHAFEPQAREALLESRRLAERRKDAWVTPHHLLWVLLNQATSTPANLSPRLTPESLEPELDHTPHPEQSLEFACTDPTLNQLLRKLLKTSHEQGTPPGVPELWDAIGAAGLLADYQAAPASPFLEVRQSAADPPTLFPAEEAPETHEDAPPVLELTGEFPTNELPLRGRDEELLRGLRLLSGRSTSCVLLTGVPGCGKSALLGELAIRFQKGLVPSPLQGFQLLNCPITAQANSSGADLAQHLYQELQASGTPTVLVMDTTALPPPASIAPQEVIQQLLGLIQPHDSLKLLVTLTPEQLADYPVSHSVNSQVALLPLLPLGVETTAAVLQDRKHAVSESHNVYLSPDAVSLISRLASSVFPAQARPNSALNLLEKVAVEYGVKLDQLALQHPDSAEPKLLLRLAELYRTQEQTKRDEESELSQGNMDRASELHFETQSSLSTEIDAVQQELAELGENRSLLECITPAWVAEVVGDLLGQVPELLLDSLPERLLRLKAHLSQAMVGPEQLFDSLIQSLMRLKSPEGQLRGVLLWVGPKGSGKSTLLRALHQAWFGKSSPPVVIADAPEIESASANSGTPATLPPRGLVHLNHLAKMSEAEVRQLKGWVSGTDAPFAGEAGDRLVILEATLEESSSFSIHASDWLRLVGQHIPVLWLEHLDAVLTFSEPTASERRKIAEEMLASIQIKAAQSGVQLTWHSTLPVEAVGLCPEDQARWGLRWGLEERLEQELAGQLLQMPSPTPQNLKLEIREGRLTLEPGEEADQA